MKTFDFAISVIFGLIVMYDAMGIRRHAGEIAVEVNELDKEVEKMPGKNPGLYHEKRRKKSKEVLDHQPVEVFWGSILGICMGALGHIIKPGRQRM